MKATEWIDRYVHEIGGYLPSKIREDVQMELHSSLMDALEERAGGQEPDEATALALLAEFGEPETVAMRYWPVRAVISPELAPYFWVILQWVLGIVTAVFLLSWLGGLLQDHSWFGSPIPVVDWLVALLLNVGVVGTGFAILDRVRKPGQPKDQTWDPETLPVLEDPDRINNGQVIGDIVVNVILISLFNFFPNLMGLIGTQNGQWGIFSLLAPEFQVHIPWLTTAWILDVILKVVVLKQGRWLPTTRWSEFALHLFNINILYRMIMGGPLLIVSVLTYGAKVVLGLILVIVAFEALSSLYRLVAKRPFAPWRTAQSQTGKI